MPTIGGVYDSSNNEITNWTGYGYTTSTTSFTSSYDAGDTVNPGLYSAAPSYYALFSRTLTVNYNANGGTGTPSSQTQVVILNAGNGNMSGLGVTVSSTKPTRTGYSFYRWAKRAKPTYDQFVAEGSLASGDSYAVGLTYSDDFNVTLYAMWMKQITLYGKGFGSGYKPGGNDYDNGGVCTFDSNALFAGRTDDEDATKNSIDLAIFYGATESNGYAIVTNPTMTGYEMSGWASSNSTTATTSRQFTLTTTIAVPNASQDYYIVWYKNWKFNDSDTSSTTITTYYNYSLSSVRSSDGSSQTAQDSAIQKFVRTNAVLSGYTFSGYAKTDTTSANYSAGQTTTEVESESSSVTTEFYAVWLRTWKFCNLATSGDQSSVYFDQVYYNYNTSKTLSMRSTTSSYVSTTIIPDGVKGSTTQTYKVYIPSRSGYDFVGYVADVNNLPLSSSNSELIDTCSTLDSGIATVSSAKAEAVYYAVWLATTNSTITLTYKTLHGVTPANSTGVKTTLTYYNCDLSSNKVVVKNPTITMADALSATGYEFQGWSTSEQADSVDYAANSSSVFNTNDNLYAVWKSNHYTISLDPNGGDLPISWWGVSNDSYGFARSLGDDMYSNTNVGENGSMARAHIRYNTNTATQIIIQASSYGEDDFDYGMFSYPNMSFDANTTYADTSLVFKHFHSSGSANIITFAIPISGSGSICVAYLKDTAKHFGDDTLRFWVVNDSFILDGVTKTISILPTPTREGYTFAGWYTSDGKKVDENTTFDAAATITARWTANELIFDNQTLENGVFNQEYSQGFTGASNGTGSYTYSIEKVTNNGTVVTANSGKYYGLSLSDTTISGLPTQAGLYAFEIKATDSNSGAVKTATITFTIEKIANTLVVSSNSAVYNGSKLTLVTISNAQGDVYFAIGTQLDASNYAKDGSTDLPTAVNAGGYTIYYYCTGNNNYLATSGVVSTAIYKATISDLTSVATILAGSGVYDGTTSYYATITPKVAMTVLSGNTANYGETIVGKIGVSSNLMPGLMSAGSITIYVKLTDMTNYNDYSTTTSVVVTAGENTIVVSANSLTYNGQAQQLVSVKNAQGNVYYSTTTSLNANNYTSGTTDITKITGTNAGSYTVYWYCVGDSNHKAKAGSVQVEIKSAQISVVPSQSGDLRYDEGTQSPTWSNYDAQQLSISGQTSGVNAGNYDAIFTPKANYTWSDGTTTGKTVSWTIKKANINATVSMDGYTYGGVVSSPAVSKNPENAAVTFSYCEIETGTYKTWANITSTSLDAGVYYIKATIAESANYNAETTSVVSFEVKKATVAVPSSPVKSYNYTGKEIQHQYSAPNGTTIVESGTVKSATNAGKYDIVLALNKNYIWSDNTTANKTVNWVINKVDGSFTFTGSTVQFDGAEHSITAQATGGSVTYSTSENGSFSSTAPKFSTVGEHTVWAKFVADSNHNAPAKTVLSAVLTITTRSYNITINVGEGEADANNPTKYNVSSQNEAQTFTILAKRDGYNLKWNISQPSTSHASVSGNTLTIPANSYGDISLTAEWSIIQYTVTITVSNTSAGLGSVSASTLTVDYGTEYRVASEKLTVGSTEVSATANSGARFVSYSVSSGVIKSDLTIAATFEKTYSVSINITKPSDSAASYSFAEYRLDTNLATSTPIQTITVDGSTTVEIGENCYFVITSVKPSAASKNVYELYNILVNEKMKGNMPLKSEISYSDSEYAVHKITSATSIEVEFFTAYETTLTSSKSSDDINIGWTSVDLLDAKNGIATKSDVYQNLYTSVIVRKGVSWKATLDTSQLNNGDVLMGVKYSYIAADGTTIETAVGDNDSNISQSNGVYTISASAQIVNLTPVIKSPLALTLPTGVTLKSVEDHIVKTSIFGETVQIYAGSWIITTDTIYDTAEDLAMAVFGKDSSSWSDDTGHLFEITYDGSEYILTIM